METQLQRLKLDQGEGKPVLKKPGAAGGGEKDSIQLRGKQEQHTTSPEDSDDEGEYEN